MDALGIIVDEVAGGGQTDDGRAAAVRSIGVDTLRGALGGARAARGDQQALIGRGIGASPGLGVGAVVFNADRALDRYEAGEEVILVVDVTTPADEPGMRVAAGIVSRRGGLASHAAVVARQWGIPAICGLDALSFDGDRGRLGDLELDESTFVAVDGTTGELHLVNGATAAPVGSRVAEVGAVVELPDAVATLLGWADSIVAEAGGPIVLANADDGELAAMALAAGAAGIGLCRTEHQFMGGAGALLAPWLVLGASPGPDALAELESFQRGRIREVLLAMDGRPVVIRLLDAPLHEFLGEIAEEVNPMLGRRGVRLALSAPWLYRMQARVIAEVTTELLGGGSEPRPRIIVPLVASPNELDVVLAWCREEIESVDPTLTIPLGTMIETPRAALVADRLARSSDFFSFGTNDLTQLTWGFSRDDLDGTVIARYVEDGIVDASPFAALDQSGVARLMALATDTGRAANPSLNVGCCGEHGADPGAVAAMVALGLDSISVAPPSVPIARLAAAHAVIDARPGGGTT